MGVGLVHWNQPQRCRRSVDAFRSQTQPCRLVIVDNGSSPRSLATLRELVPDVQILELGRNTGFGPAANVGLRHWMGHGCDVVGVAPHDALPEPDCLALLLSAMDERPAAGLVSADVGDGETPIVDPYFGGITIPARETQGWERADHPHGTLMLARSECLEQVGVFDERYFAYCEEADLGLRATAAGWEVGLVRGARVVNPTMRSGSAAVDYLMHRNTLLLVREHSGRYHAFIRLCIAVVQLLVGLVAPSRRGMLFSVRGRLRGMLDFLRGRYGPPPSGYFERLDSSGDPVVSR